MHAAKSRKSKHSSRGSTASVHSIATQPNMDGTGFGDASELYAAQWIANDPAHAAAAKLSPEDMIASHLRGAGRESFSMDHHAAAAAHPMAYQQQHHQQHQHQHQQHAVILSRHPLPGDGYMGNASFTEGDSQMLERDENDDGDSMAGGAQKASARSSANNELEMRQLFRSNKHRTLPDIARELHGNERGPNSERTRQVFAMLW